MTPGGIVYFGDKRLEIKINYECPMCNGTGGFDVDVFKEVEQELIWARNNYQDFQSTYEGFAILLEKIDELWEEIKQKPATLDETRLKKEAIRVAAMAIRFVEDLCP